MKFLQRTFKKTIRTLQKMDACTRICLMLGIILLIVVLFNKLPVIENFENNTQIKQTGKYVVKNNNELYDDFLKTDLDTKTLDKLYKNNNQIKYLLKIPKRKNFDYILIEELVKGTNLNHNKDFLRKNLLFFFEIFKYFIYL